MTNAPGDTRIVNTWPGTSVTNVAKSHNLNVLIALISAIINVIYKTTYREDIVEIKFNINILNCRWLWFETQRLIFINFPKNIVAWKSDLLILCFLHILSISELIDIERRESLCGKRKFELRSKFPQRSLYRFQNFKIHSMKLDKDSRWLVYRECNLFI